MEKPRSQGRGESTSFTCCSCAAQMFRSTEALGSEVWFVQSSSARASLAPKTLAPSALGSSRRAAFCLVGLDSVSGRLKRTCFCF